MAFSGQSAPGAYSRADMKLYYSELVISPRKACAVARYLDSPVEYIHLDMPKGEHRSPDYLALNPNGKVPTLVDGDYVLWEADAIMCYLADRADSDLWPRERKRCIEIQRWLSWNQQHFHRHAVILCFEHVIRNHFGLGDPDPDLTANALRQFRRFAAILDEHLDSRRWLVGETLSIADFAMAAELPDAERAHIPLDEFPHIRRWHEQLSELDAWRKPFPAAATFLRTQEKT